MHPEGYPQLSEIQANQQITKHITYHIRNNVLRASSPGLRTTDDRPALPTVNEVAALALPAVLPTAFALFAAAATRSRFAPLGRFTRVNVVAPARGGSRSTRRRNGLGRFSSSCKLYVGGAVSLVTVRVLLEDDEDDADDDKAVETEDGGCEEDDCPVESFDSEVSFGALARVREDTDGRRSRRAV